MDECVVFNIGRATQCVFADGLGVNPKAYSETIVLAVLILRQIVGPLLCHGTPRGVIDMELGGHFTDDGFYIQQEPLAYMVFSQRRVKFLGFI